MIDKNTYAPSVKSAKHGRTRIDDHIMLAGCILISCSFPTGLYFMAFHDFHGSQLPWKLAFSVQIVVPLILVIHYFANRRASRMRCEGVATSAAILGFWTIFGSCPFVYFGFAPMPLWERSAGLTGCLAGTLFWTIIVWRDHANYDLKLRLKQSLFIKEKSRVIYRSAQSDLIVSNIPQRNPLTRPHFWLASLCFPLLVGIGLIASRLIPHASGPHALFLILSFMSFPLSQWFLGYMGITTVYFHIYLPLKIERETGKKVILAP